MIKTSIVIKSDVTCVDIKGHASMDVNNISLVCCAVSSVSWGVAKTLHMLYDNNKIKYFKLSDSQGVLSFSFTTNKLTLGILAVLETIIDELSKDNPSEVESINYG